VASSKEPRKRLKIVIALAGDCSRVSAVIIEDDEDEEETAFHKRWLLCAVSQEATTVPVNSIHPPMEHREIARGDQGYIRLSSDVAILSTLSRTIASGRFVALA
jgi:hypothetical protein